MLPAAHPEVLAPDWVPPVLVGRNDAVEKVLARLLNEGRDTRDPSVAIVSGPVGSGTSSVARRAALRCVEEIRRTEPGQGPIWVAVRVRWCGGTVSIASDLLRRLFPEFEGRGFSIAETMAGFLRRVSRERRGAIVVLDDLGPDAPDIGPIVRALLRPERFLPEGSDAAPAIRIILAGRHDAFACWDRARRAGVPDDRRVQLPPYSLEEIDRILRDRAARAFGRPPPEVWMASVLARSRRSSGGVREAVELLKRAMTDDSLLGPGSPYLHPREARTLSVEPRLLEALRKATVDGPGFVHDVRTWEARLARAEGVRPLPATTLWRRIVRLEAAGVLRREVRTGGNGGTQSRLELLAHGDEVGLEDLLSGGTPRVFGSPYVPEED
ncbi:MAG: hypothetical protein L3J93_04575 [Thermoplasmata archaeon]|nr:hypothetical protein [Thermoplasmata archaeon]